MVNNISSFVFFCLHICTLSCISHLHTGCMKNGVYGNNCDMSCPINCKTNTCQIHDGSCFECKPGWNGAKCDTGILIHNLFFCEIIKRTVTR